MDRSRFYFKQKVKTGEINGAFDDVETAIRAFIGSFNYKGIAAGAEVTENSPPNMTAVISGPATVFDQNQRRIAWFPNQIVNCALDEDGSSTAVTNPGQERWISIFAQFKGVQSEPRVDGHGAQVYFRETESFQINVVQGAMAASNPTPPVFRSDQILLADIKLVHGQTTVTTADISTARTELIYALPGSPATIRQRNLQSVLQAMLDTVNAINTATLTVSTIVGSPYTVAANVVQHVFGQLLGFINATAVATGVSVAAISDSPLSVVAGTVQSVFGQVLAMINDACAHLTRTNTFTTVQKIDCDHPFAGLDIKNSTGIGLKIVASSAAALSIRTEASADIAATFFAEESGASALRTVSDYGIGIEAVTQGLSVSTSVGTEPTVEITPHSGGAAALRLHAQSTPPSPQNGDIWITGSLLMIRLGDVNRTISLVEDD
jgi:hypothetical protein